MSKYYVKPHHHLTYKVVVMLNETEERDLFFGTISECYAYYQLIKDGVLIDYKANGN